jgi:hypothetical protein
VHRWKTVRPRRQLTGAKDLAVVPRRRAVSRFGLVPPTPDPFAKQRWTIEHPLPRSG